MGRPEDKGYRELNRLVIPDAFWDTAASAGARRVIERIAMRAAGGCLPANQSVESLQDEGGNDCVVWETRKYPVA